MSQQMTYLASCKITRSYVCAQCWGELFTRETKTDKPVLAGDHWITIYCPQCGDDKGFVTRAYVDQRIASSAYDLMDAKNALRNVLNLPRTSESQIMKELGF